MRLLRSLLLVFLALSFPAVAQEDEDKAFLESWLQEQLSGAGRQITISGFRGALSSNATLEEMTIADDDGVWVTVRNAELTWSRAALLRGRLDVTELSAGEIDLTRLPSVAEGVSTDDAQAPGFALPDLPVSIEVEEITAARVVLGAAVLGQAATLSLDGSFELQEGTARADLDIRRLDRDDRILLGAGFANETRNLAIDLDVREGQGGLISDLLGIPGAPDLRLVVQGDAPLSDFSARISLSSDGEQRLAGAVRIAALDEAAATHGFSAELGGDMRPLFPPDLQPFFGERTALDLQGQTRADGGLELDALALNAQALRLEGQLSLAPDGLPERFNLTGGIGDDTTAVRLPVAGDIPTLLRTAQFNAQYDASQGEDWEIKLGLRGFDGPEIDIEAADLTAKGTLSRSPANALTSDITFAAEGLTHSDLALAQAIGSALSGTTKLAWTEDDPLQITALSLASGDVALTANGQVAALADGFPITGNARLDIPVLSRFGPLVNRDLGGAVRMQISGNGAPLAGTFDLSLTARTTDLAIAEPRLDPLLSGTTTLRIAAERTTEGTELESLTLRSVHASADISGQLDPQSGNLDVAARLTEISRVEPALSGPADLATTIAWIEGQPVQLTDLRFSAVDAVLTGTGTLDPTNETLPVAGSFQLISQDLSPLSELARRSLGGAISAKFDGSGALQGSQFDATLKVQSTDLKTGETRLDPLLEGTGTLSLTANRAGEAYTVQALRLAYPKLKMDAAGALNQETATLDLTANATDLTGTAPGLSGPAQIETQANWVRGGKLTINKLAASAVEAGLSATGALWPDDPNLPVEGTLSVSAQNLARFAGLLGLPLVGNITFDAAGRGALRTPEFDAELSLEGNGLRTGIAALDTLLAGTLALQASAAISEGTAPDIRRIALDTPNLTLNASGQGAGSPVSLNARLANLALFIPNFPGEVTANGSITLNDNQGRNMNVNLSATGPGGTQAQINGAVRDFGQSLGLGVKGSAPLALANPFIAPRSVEGQARFDLRVDGPPVLSSLVGQIVLSGGRVALPQANFALNEIGGNVQMGGGQARLGLTGSAGTGGGFELRGPITLTAPFRSNLTLVLNQLGITDPDLYSTTANGAITVDGPLTGGARIGGTLNLGTTELRVPSGGGSLGAIPEITHVGEPAAVRATRQRAGLIKELESTGGTPFPLDLRINAPNRIFLRGRGLDAELGGSVRLFGTTADVKASGTFELIRGRLDILGQRLNLTEGLIDLRGALDPFLRIVAETNADDVIVQVILEGLASDPSVRFVSVPELPQEEVAARLLFGRGLDSISPFQAAQLVAAAATLSGQRSGGLTGGLRNSLGLSDFDITSTEEGGTEVRAGAYLSENIYSEVAVDSEGNEEINLNIDLNPSLTVRGSASSDGNTGIGIFFERDY